MGSNEWKVLALLALDLPNSGMARVTIPDLPTVENFEDALGPVIIEVAVSSSSVTEKKRGLFSDILSRIGRFGLRILKQTPMRIVKRLIRQAAQRLACETWSLTQSGNIGQQINSRLQPCPCNVEQVERHSDFREEKLSSIVKVIGQVQDYFDTTIVDDAFRHYFHPGAASCYRQSVNIP